jgi:hypothetical protein
MTAFPAGEPFVSDLGPRPGYVVGQCGHAVAGSEWAAGFRTCERCPADTQAEDPHADCNPAARAGTEVTCDRCKLTYTVTPSTDYYCAGGSAEHCCEPCLMAGAGLTKMYVIGGDPS